MASKDLAREELIRNRARTNTYALSEDVWYLLARVEALEAVAAAARELRDHYRAARPEEDDFMDWHCQACLCRDALWAALLRVDAREGA
jgi:hypothetical protein